MILVNFGNWYRKIEKHMELASQNRKHRDWHHLEWIAKWKKHWNICALCVSAEGRYLQTWWQNQGKEQTCNKDGKHIGLGITWKCLLLLGRRVEGQ
jgi:hypothetical protein